MKDRTIVLTRYAVPGAVKMRIALFADLHGHDPSACIALLRAEKPDIVILAGDIIDILPPESAAESVSHHGLHKLLWDIDGFFGAHSEYATRASYENGLALMRAAADTAPAYFASGNHDFYLTDEDVREIRETGVNIVNTMSVQAVVNGQRLLIGGFTCEDSVNWLSRFAARDEYKLLICHRPEYYAQYVRKLPVDLTFSGHAHGGQWRLFNRGLFAPGQGLFPKLTKGVYENRLVVSAGLSNSTHIPRLNNPMEVVMIEVGGGS